jgi:hypothetical protein
MAGLGRKVFAPGEVLTATNVQNYLMDQAVQVYAGTAARGSAIGSATTQGMVAYLADVNSVQMATGTATWVNVDSLPIVAGTATRDALYPSPVAGNTVFRSDTGNMESYYPAYSTAVPGGRDSAGWYATSRVDGLVPIVPTSVNVGSGTATIGALGKVTLTTVGTNISLNGVFTSQFDYYKIIFRALPTTGGSTMSFRMRAAGTDASTGIYHNQGTLVVGGSSATINNNGLTSLNFIVGHANVTSQATFDITNPFNTTQTNFNCISNGWNGAAQTSIIFGGYVGSTVSYDGISFNLASTTSTGTLQVYGYN